ncbi:MAG: hypothetical protein GX444_04110 [Myxococcales bacterium]|nr:hypothetical protein [Myxococcales bacterium]
MKRLPSLFALTLIMTLLAAPAFAANGLDATSSGVRAAGMGGTDLAIALDATAIDTNPAGLMQLTGHRVDFGTSLLMPQLHFKNDLNDADGEPLYVLSPVAAWGYKLKNLPLATGFGVFTQGGAGTSSFELKHALLGNDTRYYSNIQTIKIAGALAWAPHPTIALGVAPHLSLSRMDLDLPYTRATKWLRGHADPTNMETWNSVFRKPVSEGGFGFDEATFRLRLNNATAYGVGLKAGALWMPIDAVHVGVAYTLMVPMDYIGHARMDLKPQLSAGRERLYKELLRQGLSAEEAARQADLQMQFWGIEDNDLESRYDSHVEFTWPQRAGLGLSFRPGESWLLGVDGSFINWAKTMQNVKWVIEKPNNRNSKHVLGQKRKNTILHEKWDDQFVVAAGVQYEFVENFWGRLGYNYGNNPTPDDSVTPILPGIQEHHATAGLGYRHGMWELNGFYEYGVPNTQKAADEHWWADEYNGSETTQGSHNAGVMMSLMF